MAYLAKANKPDLLEICEELDIELNSNVKVSEIKKLILESPEYNEEIVKVMLDRIIENRLEEKAEKERDRIEKEKDRIEREKEKDRQHELEMKKLELAHRKLQETKATVVNKRVTALENQLAESKDLLNEDTRQKLTPNSPLRQIESEKKNLQDQLNEEKNQEKQVSFLNAQLTELKKRADDDAQQNDILEEVRKKQAKDIETLQRQIEEQQAHNDELAKSKKKLQSEIEDLNIELESQRAKIYELEKKKQNFDQLLAEEKAASERITEEPGNTERKSLEKETEILPLTRSIDETPDKLDELEKLQEKLQMKLHELVNSQGADDNDVHELEKTKKILENQLTKQKTQVTELEDDLQLTEGEQKLCSSVPAKFPPKKGGRL